MTDDFLSPDDHTLPGGADTEEQPAEDVGLDASPERDEPEGPAGPEHFGRTPPD